MGSGRAWVVVCAAAAFAAPSGALASAPVYTEARAAPAPVEGRGRAGLPELSRLAESVLPAVVGVLTTQDDREAPPPGDPLKDFFDQFHGDGSKKGLATGFV